MKTNDVTIIIVSYNTRSLTLECLRSVESTTDLRRAAIVVVDNASSDGSADAIESEFGDRLRLIRSDENLGFARANNLAARHADSKYLLLLNPDTVVLPGAIETLLAFAHERPENRIYGGRTLFADRSLNPTSCWRRMTVHGLTCQALGLSSAFRRSALFNPEAYAGWARDTIREVDIVTGCFMLITRALWDELDGFDESFFMYGEEADLCLRARRLGARPIITPEAEIVHYGGACEQVRSEKLVRLMQAKRMLIKRHWRPSLKPLGLGLLTGWPATRALAELNRGGSSSTWTSVWNERKRWLESCP